MVDHNRYYPNKYPPFDDSFDKEVSAVMLYFYNYIVFT